jgi:hypothetical protein
MSDDLEIREQSREGEFERAFADQKSEEEGRLRRAAKKTPEAVPTQTELGKVLNKSTADLSRFTYFPTLYTVSKCKIESHGSKLTNDLGEYCVVSIADPRIPVSKNTMYKYYSTVPVVFLPFDFADMEETYDKVKKTEEKVEEHVGGEKSSKKHTDSKNIFNLSTKNLPEKLKKQFKEAKKTVRETLKPKTIFGTKKIIDNPLQYYLEIDPTERFDNDNFLNSANIYNDKTYNYENKFKRQIRNMNPYLAYQILHRFGFKPMEKLDKNKNKIRVMESLNDWMEREDSKYNEKKGDGHLTEQSEWFRDERSRPLLRALSMLSDFINANPMLLNHNNPRLRQKYSVQEKPYEEQEYPFGMQNANDLYGRSRHITTKPLLKSKETPKSINNDILSLIELQNRSGIIQMGNGRSLKQSILNMPIIPTEMIENSKKMLSQSGGGDIITSCSLMEDTINSLVAIIESKGSSIDKNDLKNLKDTVLKVCTYERKLHKLILGAIEHVNNAKISGETGEPITTDVLMRDFSNFDETMGKYVDKLSHYQTIAGRAIQVLVQNAN